MVDFFGRVVDFFGHTFQGLADLWMAGLGLIARQPIATLGWIAAVWLMILVARKWRREFLAVRERRKRVDFSLYLTLPEMELLADFREHPDRRPVRRSKKDALRRAALEILDQFDFEARQERYAERRQRGEEI